MLEEDGQEMKETFKKAKDLSDEDLKEEKDEDNKLKAVNGGSASVPPATGASDAFNPRSAQQDKMFGAGFLLLLFMAQKLTCCRAVSVCQETRSTCR